MAVARAKSRSAGTGQSKDKLPKGLRIIRSKSSSGLTTPDQQRIDNDRIALENLRKAIEKARDVTTKSLDRTVRI